jgi:hypothetical protein
MSLHKNKNAAGLFTCNGSGGGAVCESLDLPPPHAK